MLGIDLSEALGTATIQLLVTATFGGLIGLVWATSRRRREGRVAAQEAFYRAYGQWFAIWKEWGALLDAARTSPQGPVPSGSVPDATVEALVSKAAQVEADFEALLLRVAAERRLTSTERRHLGQFREGAQHLRNRIKDRQKLTWAVTGADPNRTEPYVLFKA